ncbi:MAG: bacillithiol system redox-active protein YtxJ [Flavobacteriaceae bacterium]|nr:bacillithiol system redox-active protein YtxJ [Flavobacteriaceae bacterium]
MPYLLSNTTNEESAIDWIQLTDTSQLDIIIENSKVKTQAIFKHSTRCGISSSALRKFEKQFDTSNLTELHYLDLLNQRAISNEIAQRFNVIHQSPQLLIIKNGVVEAHDSHYGILDMDVS